MWLGRATDERRNVPINKPEGLAFTYEGIDPQVGSGGGLYRSRAVWACRIGVGPDHDESVADLHHMYAPTACCESTDDDDESADHY